MLSNRSHALVGERCPSADIAKSAENSNIRAVSAPKPVQPRAGSSRTAQERTGAADTRLTQRPGFSFVERSL